MARYQAKHRRPRGNQHTQDIWVIAFMLSAFTDALLVRYNGATGVVTLNWWTTFVRVFGIMGILSVVYAVALAMFTIWNLEREARNSARRRAERHSCSS